MVLASASFSYTVGRSVRNVVSLSGWVVLFLDSGYNFSVKNIAFLLHLYQPPTQEEEVLKRIAKETYLPLVKFLQSNKKFKVTLNTPLSLLEQMDRFGYTQWFKDIRELIRTDNVELVGSGAYHPLLTKIPEKFAEKQIMLNEYGLGYYFGQQSGFEGESSIVIRNLNGFFPPEMAVNENLLRLVSSYGYKWMIVDEGAIPPELEDSGFGVYKFDEVDTMVVARNRKISNLLSFKRDLETKDFIDGFNESGKSCVVSLDGEYFGHHHKDGLVLLELLINELYSNNIHIMTVSDYVDDERVKTLDRVLESTWGANYEDLTEGNKYPRWDVRGNTIHELQWQLVEKLASTYDIDYNTKVVEGFENIAIWKPEILSSLDDTSLMKKVEIDILVCKALHSDQFWWASFDPLEIYWMVDKGADLFVDLANKLGNTEFKDFVERTVGDIKALVEEKKFKKNSA